MNVNAEAKIRHHFGTGRGRRNGNFILDGQITDFGVMEWSLVGVLLDYEKFSFGSQRPLAFEFQADCDGWRQFAGLNSRAISLKYPLNRDPSKVNLLLIFRQFRVAIQMRPDKRAELRNTVPQLRRDCGTSPVELKRDTFG